MPLLDHFHPPLSQYRHWEGFHSKWTGEIVDQLNRILPDRYFAEPMVHLGALIEADVAAFDTDVNGGGLPADANTGNVATWAPSKPTWSSKLDGAVWDVFEVRVIREESGPAVVGVIELVSPSNKARPAQRHAFVTKCASYLQQGVSLVVVDVVTSRNADLHQQLIEALRLPNDFTVDWPENVNEENSLSAAAFRTRRIQDEISLDGWCESLALEAPLPTLPLFLSSDYAVPVDLEESYVDACKSLRIDI